MKEFFNKVNKLIEVKKIIALTVVTVYCYLAVKGVIGADVFSSVAVMVVGYYFGQSTIKGAFKE